MLAHDQHEWERVDSRLTDRGCRWKRVRRREEVLQRRAGNVAGREAELGSPLARPCVQFGEGRSIALDDQLRPRHVHVRYGAQVVVAELYQHGGRVGRGRRQPRRCDAARRVVARAENQQEADDGTQHTAHTWLTNRVAPWFRVTHVCPNSADESGRAASGRVWTGQRPAAVRIAEAMDSALLTTK